MNVLFVVLRILLPAALLAGGVAGCSGAAEPFRDCHMDSLSGTWRVAYRETNGNCGAISDEMVNTSAAASGSTASSCRSLSYGISSNKCRVEQSFTCPTTGGGGTQAWTLVNQQMSPTAISGTGTVQISDSVYGACRSTYELTWSKL